MNIKRKLSICLVSIIILCYTSGQSVMAVMSLEQTVESMIEETKKKAKINHLSVVIVEHGVETYYGENDREALYQIGSMTKAFTALGILYLADDGRINLHEPIDTYIPGFYATYHEERVIPTVNDLLYQISGYTNSEKDYPSAGKGMSLAEWAESINGSELSVYPGEQYAYSNVNYNLLGVIIENVSQMSYEEFMKECILEPLGLHNTYCGETFENEIIFEGTRLGFSFAFPYDCDVNEGSIPAGYFYSNITDMCRWLKIQMGEEFVSEKYRRIIERSHRIASDINQNLSYVSGWELYGEQIIGHSGATPNYSSRIMFDNQNKVGVCVLTNLNTAASTDYLCTQILYQMTGRTTEGFIYDIWRIFDWIFTGITISGLTLMVLVWYVRNRDSVGKISLYLGIIIAILAIAILIVMPILFQASWKTILLVWSPISMSSGILVLLMDCIVLWATFFRTNRRKNENNNKNGEGTTPDNYRRISHT